MIGGDVKKDLQDAINALVRLSIHCSDQLNYETVQEALELLKDDFEIKYEFEERTEEEP